MRKILGLAVVLVLLYATLLTAIPTSAVSAGPYNSSDGCIKAITIKTTKSLSGGKATYYNAVVNSSLHGLNKNYRNHTMHVAIGTKNTKFFVYSAESADKMSYSKNSVLDLVNAFEKENPDWQVVAAINGDFFNKSTGEPEMPMIQNYQMLKSYLLPDSAARGRGLVGVSEATGKVVYFTQGNAYREENYGIQYKFDGNYQVQVLDSNGLAPTKSYASTLATSPAASTVSFTTSDYGQGAYAGKTVYVVKLSRYRKDLGQKNDSGNQNTYYFAEGKITGTIEGKNGMKPPKGEAYIAVTSESQAPLLKVGTVVRCQKQLMWEWKNVSNAIGFKQQILAEGNLMFKNAYSRLHTGDGASKIATEKWTEDMNDYPHCFKARTAIGFKEDGTFVLLTAEYKSPNVSATYYELSCQFKALGCTNAFLLDGGGSSAMVIREGDKLVTVHHAENGNGGEGRSIANIAIMAVLRDGKTSKFPTTNMNDDGTPDTIKKTTAKQTTAKKTTAVEAVDEEITETIAESQTSAASESGCGGALAFPAILATGAVTSAGFLKRRKNKKEK